MMNKLLGEIEALLKESDTECLELTDACSQIPGSEKLIQEIEAFDFENALKTLDDLRLTLIT